MEWCAHLHEHNPKSLPLNKFFFLLTTTTTTTKRNPL